MANIKYTDADAAERYSHSTKAGTLLDPDLSPEDIVDQLALIEAAVDGLETAQTTGNTALAAIQTAVQLIDNTVAGNELQVDVVTMPAVTVTGVATETTLAAISTKTPELGQALAAAAVPVVLTSIQQTALTPPAAITGFATETNQTTGNTALSAIQASVAAATPAGTNNIGDVDIASIAAGDNNIGNVDIVTLPNVTIGAAIPAGTNNIGDVDVLTLPSLAAGELHIGEVAGSGRAVKVALVVSTTPAYTAGDSVGGKITIANAVRISGGVSILVSLQILDRANQKPAGTILIYDADPTAATLTDNALVVNSTDDLKVVAAIPVVAGDYTTINNKAFANLSALARQVQAGSGTTLYASFTTTSTPTFAATSDVQLIFGFAYVN